MDSLLTVWTMFRTQTVRFLLTISGIVVGVASLVALASFLQVGERVLRQSSSRATGDDLLTVSYDWEKAERSPNVRQLDQRDLQAMRTSTAFGGSATFSALFGMSRREVTAGKVNDEPLVVGVVPETMGTYGLALREGRSFRSVEFEATDRIAILGSSVLADEPLHPGDSFRIAGRPYTIIGILKAKPALGPGDSWNWNHRVLVPARTLRIDFDPSGRPSSIIAQVTPVHPGETLKGTLRSVTEVIETILLEGRDSSIFRIRGSGTEGNTEQIILATVRALAFATTAFSLMVGGINIMNIMLVTVTERTVEIGVRRALGATQRDILLQFLRETLAVAFIGAILGLLVGCGLTAGIAAIMRRWVDDWPFEIAAWSAVLGVASSAGIALLFGLLPARRAAQLAPVDALRSA